MTSSLGYGFLIAFLASVFIYLAHFGFTHPLPNTLAALLALYLLLKSDPRVWFWSGFFIGLFWFWWIGLSFIHYQMPWAIPFVILFIATVYGGIFWLIAKTATIINKSVAEQRKPTLFTIHYSPQGHLSLRSGALFTLTIKALGLLILSYVHPFGFDWFKPELMFTESYLGIGKWQFAIILAAVVLAHTFKKPILLLLALGAYDPSASSVSLPGERIALVTTHTPVEQKWDESAHPAQFQALLASIDKAIDTRKRLVILPESVFPVFLNHDQTLFDALKQRAQKINIVTGALYWDGETPRNAAYIFTTEGKVTVANKVILVPFGEANPLPDFLSNWVNKVFYDNAVDYKASTDVVDYMVEGKRYRNAICFEATSEKLYEGDPKKMIVLSNNGWFTPSIEPVLQRLLLQYYSRKYGTTIYHSVNMSPSYIIINGEVLQP
jgi:apolipoprotein N-acyltransferase